MSLVAPTLQAFFTDRLLRQLQASPQTVASYRDTLRLLLIFVQEQKGTPASSLQWDDLDETTIQAFLEYLGSERSNSARTRNLRLCAIRSLFKYAALRHPEHAAVIARVLSIPPARFERRPISFLDQDEARALIEAPDASSWEGRRDRVLLALAIQTGLRVSELIALERGDVILGTGAHVRCRQGKGRKQRSVPLTASVVRLLTAWLTERGGQDGDPLFPTRTGRRLSRDAIEHRVATHATTASKSCPSLKGKRLHPHVLRHSCAMSLLHAGVDTTVIALWLGHVDVRSTQPYLHADLTIKERALALVAPTDVKPGRYRPTDAVIAFLEAL